MLADTIKYDINGHHKVVYFTDCWLQKNLLRSNFSGELDIYVNHI